MGINYNNQEPGETNYNEGHNDQHATASAQIHFPPGGQYDHSTLSSTGNSNSPTSETSDKLHHRNNILTMTISPLRKYPIIPRKGTEPHVNKSQY